MYDDLIVVTYPRTTEAVMTWLRLYLLHSSRSLAINSALLLAVSETGEACVLQTSELASFPACREMRFLGSLARQVIDRDIEQMGHPLVDAGLDETFLNGLSQALTTESSAIIFYAPRDSLFDVSQLLAVLFQERGTVHHTTLTPTAAQTILELATSM